MIEFLDEATKIEGMYQVEISKSCERSIQFVVSSVLLRLAGLVGSRFFNPVGMIKLLITGSEKLNLCDPIGVGNRLICMTISSSEGE